MPEKPDPVAQAVEALKSVLPTAKVIAAMERLESLKVEEFTIAESMRDGNRLVVRRRAGEESPVWLLTEKED